MRWIWEESGNEYVQSILGEVLKELTEREKLKIFKRETTSEDILYYQGTWHVCNSLSKQGKCNCLIIAMEMA